MKTTRLHALLSLLMVALLGLAISGCEKGSLLNANDEQSGLCRETALGKSGTDIGTDTDTITWPVVASGTFHFNEALNIYQGGMFSFGSSNKSKFTLEDGALTPPPTSSWGKDVVITMVMNYDRDKNELDITFSPHGTRFSPRAQLKIDYSPLGISVPTLYYIDDNGKRITQKPDQIMRNKKWLFIRLDHFSRYALAQA